MNISDSRSAEGAEWENWSVRYNRLVQGQGSKASLQPYHFFSFD